MVYVYSVAKSLIFDPNCILHNNVFGTISTFLFVCGPNIRWKVHVILIGCSFKQFKCNST